MTEIRSHRAPSKRIPRKTVKRALVSAAGALLLVVTLGTGYALAEGPGDSSTCVGTTPDAGGNVDLHCVIPMPRPVTVTVPGPTVTVPVTETTTITLPPVVSTTTVTQTVTVTATTRPPTTTPPTTTPPSTGWPTLTNTGVPAGWVPTATRTTDLIVTQAGAVIQDIRLVGANIIVRANNVTIRRVELLGGQVSNYSCPTGLIVEDSSFLPPQGQARGGSPEGAITPGGYTARRVKIVNRIEGLRSGDCGPVTVADSYLDINDGGNCVLHADGIQGYGGRGIIVRNTWIDARKMTCGTAPFFYPRGQGNVAPVDIDGLWLAGGTMSLRLGVGPATVKRVQILNGSWAYAPVDVYCPAISTWDVSIVSLTGGVVRAQTCTGSGT